MDFIKSIDGTECFPWKNRCGFRWIFSSIQIEFQMFYHILFKPYT